MRSTWSPSSAAANRHQQDQVGIARRRPRRPRPSPGRAAGRGAKMPGVSTSRICASPCDRDAHQPRARRLRLGADDRDFLADQRIDQRRLARIGRADHGDEAGAGCSFIAPAPASASRPRFRLPACSTPSAVGFADAPRSRPDRETGAWCAPVRRDHLVVGRARVRARRPVPGAPTWDAGAPRPASSSSGAQARRMNASAASSPPSINSAPISASTTSPTTLSLWLAPSSRACLPSRIERRQAELAADLGAGLARDQRIVAARQIAFGLVREPLVEPARDRPGRAPGRRGTRAARNCRLPTLEWVSARSNSDRSLGLVAELSRGRRRRARSLVRFAAEAVADPVRRAAR